MTGHEWDHYCYRERPELRMIKTKGMYNQVHLVKIGLVKAHFCAVNRIGPKSYSDYIFPLPNKKRTSAIRLAMFCEQRRRRTVHLCQKPMLLTFATFCCMLPTILWLKMRPMMLLCRMYISSMLAFFFFFLFFLFLRSQNAVRGRRKAETSLHLRVQY